MERALFGMLQPILVLVRSGSLHLPLSVLRRHMCKTKQDTFYEKIIICNSFSCCIFNCC